jgi:hypothetical protein
MVRIRLEVGDVDLRDLAGQVDIETDVGDVTGTGLTVTPADAGCHCQDLPVSS